MSLKAKLINWITNTWFTPYSQRSLVTNLLLPVAVLYGALFTLNAWAYRKGWRKAWRAPVPVVVVGNFIVGGAGKTPVVIALARALQANGLRVGVVSRGYGRNVETAQLVGSSSTAAEVGDEPLLIARAARVPVAVAAKRATAARLLLKSGAKSSTPIDVIISDDGLQHHALARDIEWAVFDERGAGNGCLLPAGPLREPVRAVDATLSSSARLPRGLAKKLAFEGVSTHFISSTIHSAYSIGYDHKPQEFRAFSKMRCAAVAGIGNPQKFFDSLTAAGVKLLQCVALDDHYDYQQTPNPFTGIKADAIFITEKDAIKCAPNGQALDSRLWAVTHSVELPAALIRQVIQQLSTKISSLKAQNHGQKTA